MQKYTIKRHWEEGRGHWTVDGPGMARDGEVLPYSISVVCLTFDEASRYRRVMERRYKQLQNRASEADHA